MIPEWRSDEHYYKVGRNADGTSLPPYCSTSFSAVGGLVTDRRAHLAYPVLGSSDL